MRAVHLVYTYSIVARDPHTGQMGVAVQSHYFSVGSVVPWAEAGVGVVATQARARIDYGPQGLALMRQGRTAGQALEALLEADEGREDRQVAMLDAHGNVAVHTGSRCIAAAGHLVGDNVAVQANLMVDGSVWPAMLQAYTAAAGDLADRMLAALAAAQAAGGDIRGQQSAALLVVSGEPQDQPWQGRLLDLRVEDHPRPVEELTRLVRLRKAYQLHTRARELMTAQQVEEAQPLFTRAAQLAPDVVELKFWAAVTLFKAGRDDEALLLFRDVFAQAPVWADLVPRLVPTGLLPDDPATLKRITDQRTPNVHR